MTGDYAETVLKEHADLIAVYRATPDTLRALIKDLTSERARLGGGGDDAWSVSEIVAHLYDGEWPWFERVRRMREEDDPWLRVYPNADYSKPLLTESMAKFTALRAEHIAYLEALAPEEWQRTGRHETWGPISILWATRHLAAHDATHLAQIARRVLTTS